MRMGKVGFLVYVFLVLGGCAGTPKVSQWISPPERHLTVSNVFDAAIIAGTENKFTVINSDRHSGVISMKQEVYGGEQKNNERRMSIRMKELTKNTVEVRTKVSGSDFGIVEGALGGLVHKELTSNFYVYLFRELNITDPNQKQVIIVDENSTELDRGRIPTVTKKAATTNNKTESRPNYIQTPPLTPPAETKSERNVASESQISSNGAMVVSENKVKLMQKPSTKAPVVKTLAKGVTVQVVKQKDGWFLVELGGGETGWCQKGSLATKN